MPSLAKPLSALYLDLISVDSPKMEHLWAQWRADLPDLDIEDWKGCLEDSVKLLISTRDKLIQIHFLHRVYYMPQRLHRIYPQRSPDCTYCVGDVGTYLHMFWSCPRVAHFWGEMVELVNVRLQLTLPTTPKLLLLGIQDDDQRHRCTKLLISYLFYHAKREIIVKWNSPPPSVASWEKSNNTERPLYKLP